MRHNKRSAVSTTASKSITLALLTLTMLSPVAALADVYVNGYTKSNGTVVSPYTRGEPDGLSWNNKR